MIKKYVCYPNIYNMLLGQDGMRDIQHVMKNIYQLVSIALTKLSLSPGHIKLALLSIDKLQKEYISQTIHRDLDNNTCKVDTNDNYALDWNKLIHDELLVDFKQDQLYIIDSCLRQSNQNTELNLNRYIYRSNPACNNLNREEITNYLNNFGNKSSSDQTNILYGAVCSLIVDGLLQHAQLEDIIYILTLPILTQYERISGLFNMLDDIQVSKILKYKIPI